LLWEPADPTEADINLLRRLVALRSGDQRLEKAGEDLAAAAAAAEAEVALIFHKLYLESGRFIGSESPTSGAGFAARETPRGLRARILDTALARRYPQHPTFAGDLDDGTVQLLIEKFFAVGTARTPGVQQAAGAFAAPLGFAEVARDREPYRFNPESDAPLS